MHVLSIRERKKDMEYKNRCASPLDMADGDILNDILDESYSGYGDSETQNRTISSCGCEHRSSCSRNSSNGINSCGNGECIIDRRLENFSLAMVYCPDQEWRELYTEDEALSHGTLFKELDLPFYPACRSCK